jgi:transcriptional regulator with XRE-family HTH domain
MESTPQAAKVLANAVYMHNWDQSDLARESGLSRPTVSLHLNCSRPVRDDHLAAYCSALDRSEQTMLVAAWLRDTLPAQTQEQVLTPGSSVLKEDVRAWRPTLDSEQRSMIQWWEQKLASDMELDQIFRAITRRVGWPGKDL